MKTFLTLAAAVWLSASARAADAPLAGEARQALARATDFMRSISTQGGYLWWYSEDLKERAGENKATDSQIWVQPPGTPSMGMAFLRAHRATGDRRFLEAAEEAADALTRGQLESGGWDYLVEFDPANSRRWYLRSDKGKLSPEEIARRKNVSTYDDDNTQSALRFLMAVVQTPEQADRQRRVRIRESLDYGLAKMLEAQYPNGAWPQRYDGRKRDAKDYPVMPARIPSDYPRTHPKLNYAEFYTFNDHTIRDCVVTMLEAHKWSARPEFLAAAKKAGDFIILAQLPDPQPAWAQQYNARMEPAWARAFEPPAVCSAESVGVIRLLVDLHLETGESKYLKPIPEAIAWLKRSQIGKDTWARYYELEKNKPIYGDRDGKIYYKLEEISEERRTGYGWQGNFGVPSVINVYEELTKIGREAMLEKRKPRELKASQADSRLKAMEPAVRKVTGELDARGRWLSKGRIETQLFIKNVNVLCDYLEMGR